MKKVININFQGQVIAIEETAYEILKRYIESLKTYFAREEGGDEIVNDIENRIAELFGNRLKLGINCITDEDVESVISSIGRPEDFDADYEQVSAAYEKTHTRSHASQSGAQMPPPQAEESRTLYRSANDKIIGGVCSGLAHYFKIDPVWMRIVFVLLFGVLFWVYLILWIVLKPKSLQSNVVKRLYRNPGDKFIGGVCGGIAAYFKIDAWIPRLLFALPLLLNLMGMISIPFFPWNRIFDNVDFHWNINLAVMIAYAVLWIIIPKAATVKQKLEMMGEEAYIKSIRETVSENVANVKSKTDSAAASNPPTVADAHYVAATPPQSALDAPSAQLPPEPPRFAPKRTEPQPSERSGCLNAFVVLLKIIFFTFVGIFAVALLSMLGAFLFAGTQLLPLKSLFIDSGNETRLLIASAALMVGVPVVSMLVWIARRSLKMKSRPVIGVVGTVLWFSGVALGGVLVSKVAVKYKVESSAEKIVELASFVSETLYVDMQPYLDDYAEIKSDFGPGADFGRLPYTTVNEDSLLFRKINVLVENSPDSQFSVRTISAVRGKELRSAKADLQQFSYAVVQKDSLLLLSEFLSVPVKQGFRDQSVTVEIRVPAGKKIEMSHALDEYRNNEPPSAVRKRIRKFGRILDDDRNEGMDAQEPAETQPTDTI